MRLRERLHDWAAAVYWATRSVRQLAVRAESTALRQAALAATVRSGTRVGIWNSAKKESEASVKLDACLGAMLQSTLLTRPNNYRRGRSGTATAGRSLFKPEPNGGGKE